MSASKLRILTNLRDASGQRTLHIDDLFVPIIYTHGPLRSGHMYSTDTSLRLLSRWTQSTVLVAVGFNFRAWQPPVRVFNFEFRMFLFLKLLLTCHVNSSNRFTCCSGSERNNHLSEEKVNNFSPCTAYYHTEGRHACQKTGQGSSYAPMTQRTLLQLSQKSLRLGCIKESG